MKKTDIFRVFRGILIVVTIFLAATWRFDSTLSLRDRIIILGTVGVFFLAFILFVNRQDLLTATRKTKRIAAVVFILGAALFAVGPIILRKLFTLNVDSARFYSWGLAALCWLVSAVLMFLSIFGGNRPGSIGPSVDDPHVLS